MEMFFPVSLAVISILLIVTILLQQRGTALGAAFGGGDSGAGYSAKRGLQGKLYQATVILGALFILLAFLNLLSS